MKRGKHHNIVLKRLNSVIGIGISHRNIQYIVKAVIDINGDFYIMNYCNLAGMTEQYPNKQWYRNTRHRYSERILYLHRHFNLLTIFPILH